MADRDEVIAFCDELLAVERFDDYGPNGLQVPGRTEVRTIATGVTANRELLERAIALGAELVLVHHGLFFGEGPRALSEQLAGRLRILLEAEASLGAYHLPLDAHREIGNNALLCSALELEATEIELGQVRGAPIGVVGRSAPGVEATELVRRVESVVGRRPLVFDAGPVTVHTVGIVSGGGSSALAEAARMRLDAFVTGEPSEHVMGDAREAGLHFLAAGHYATETFGIRRLGELVAERFGLDHRFIDVPNPI